MLYEIVSRKRFISMKTDKYLNLLISKGLSNNEISF